MKRIFSIILAVAMIMTMITVPASAAVSVQAPLANDATGTTINNHTAKETVYGIAGKAATDASTFASRTMPDTNTGNHKVQFNYSPTNWGDLIVFAVSFYKPVNIANVMLTGNGGVGISSPIKMSDSGVVDGWNRVVFVYDYSTTASAVNEEVGRWAAYLNGECVYEFGTNGVKASHEYVTKAKLSQLRLLFGCSSKEQLSMYADDCVVYTVSAPTDADKAEFLATLEVGKPALDASSKYTVNGTKVVADRTATVADITSGTNAVRVYNANGALITSATSTLKHGDKIVVEDTVNKIFNYYDVTEKGLITYVDNYTAATTAGFGQASTKFSSAAGLNEKADDDESIKVTETSAGAKYMYFTQDFDEEIYLENGKRRENYVVADVNVRNVDYASGGFMRFALSTNQVGLVKDTNFKNFSSSGWTHFRLVFSAPAGDNYKYVDWKKNMPDIAEDPDIINKYIGHSVLYINGVKASEQDIKVTANSNYTTGTNFNQTVDRLLFQFYDGNASNARSVYFDDMKIYTCDTDPGAPTAAELAEGSKYRINNTAKAIYCTEATTLKDIKAANPYAELVAFSDNIYTNQIADDVTLKIGNVVTVKADNGMYTTYIVSNPDTVLKFIQTNAAGFTGKYNATYTDEAADIAGKTDAAYVKADRAANTSGQTYIQVDYDKYMSIDTSKYVVLSLNVLPTSNAAVFEIGSNGGNGLLPTSVKINNAVVRNQWNKVVIVMENGSTEENPTPSETIYSSCSAARNASPHKCHVYVNGKLIGSGATQFGMHWKDSNDRVERIFRILTENSSKVDASVAYIDDLILYEAETLDAIAPTVMPEIGTVEGALISGGNFMPMSDVAVSALPEGATVFADAACATAVTEGNIAIGQVIAYQNGSDVSYYTVTEPVDIEFCNITAYTDVKVSNGTAASVAGIDGGDDTAFEIFSTDRIKQGNAYVVLGNYKYATFSQRPYTVFETDFKFGEHGTSIFLASNQHSKISRDVVKGNPAVNKEGWNRLTCVVNYDTGRSDTYVNGVYIGSNTSAVYKNGAKGEGEIRLVMYDDQKGEETVVSLGCVDNVKINISVTNPLVTPFAYEASADSITFTACDYIANGYDYVVIVAAYDADNNLVGNVALGTDTATIAKNADAAYYVGYIFNSTTGVIPVTQAIKVE